MDNERKALHNNWLILKQKEKEIELKEILAKKAKEKPKPKTQPTKKQRAVMQEQVQMI